MKTKKRGAKRAGPAEKARDNGKKLQMRNSAPGNAAQIHQNIYAAELKRQ
jgi:hypothetical protein